MPMADLMLMLCSRQQQQTWSQLPSSAGYCTHMWVNNARYMPELTHKHSMPLQCHRVFTVRELARSQGFPDDFEFCCVTDQWVKTVSGQWEVQAILNRVTHIFASSIGRLGMQSHGLLGVQLDMNFSTHFWMRGLIRRRMWLKLID